MTPFVLFFAIPIILAIMLIDRMMADR